MPKCEVIDSRALSMAKRILMISPILPEYSAFEAMVLPLGFLKSEYELCCIDALLPLTENMTVTEYYHYWKTWLVQFAAHYDVLMGFSLGGVVLQQSFELLEVMNKPVILFSTPSFSDPLLLNRLGEVRRLVESQQLHKAVATLNDYVAYPDRCVCKIAFCEDEKQISLRLSKGLSFVSAVDSRQILRTSKNNTLHIVGDKSQLVNHGNVVKSEYGKLEFVPNAGMRVLQNNLGFCQRKILEYLNHATEK